MNTPRLASLFAVIAAIALSGTALAIEHQGHESVTANYRLVVPLVAADSASANKPTPAPSPTTTPASGETRVYYVVNSHNTSKMLIVSENPLGPASSLAILTSNADWIAFPSVSPDGRRLLYERGSTGSADIYVSGVDGSNPVVLFSPGGWKHRASWSPDGTKIVYAATVAGQTDIYTVNADGSAPVRLTTGGHEHLPAWSPDGMRIAFVSDGSGDADIYSMAADGSDKRRLTTDPNVDAEPAWSPDSTKLAFFSDRSGTDEVWVMNADGSGQRQLTSGHTYGAYQPAWSPSGRAIVYVVESASGSMLQFKELASGAVVDHTYPSGVYVEAPVWVNVR